MSRHGKRSENSVIISVSIPKDLKAELETLAKSEGHTLSSLVRHKLEEIAKEMRAGLEFKQVLLEEAAKTLVTDPDKTIAALRKPYGAVPPARRAKIVSQINAIRKEAETLAQLSSQRREALDTIKTPPATETPISGAHASRLNSKMTRTSKGRAGA